MTGVQTCALPICFPVTIGTAERVKIEVGSAVEELDVDAEDIPVQGRDLITGKPKEIMVGYKEIARALDKSIIRIEDAVMETLSLQKTFSRMILHII